ncbi:MAG: L,D-transpeptidase family protein [Lachnospiraceae bacterium]|nr:L,D-transpeptidase family protein [Lachnospiraceae bacterium]
MNIFKKLSEKKPKGKLGKKMGKKMGIIYVALVACLGTTYVANAQQYNSKFIEGTIINGVDAGEKTVDEVEAAYAKAIANYSLTLEFRGGSTETIKGADIDLTYKPGSEVSDLLTSQNPFSWIMGAFGGTRTLTANIPVTYNKSKLRKMITTWPELFPKNETESENATLVAGDDNLFEIQSEVKGTKADRDKLIDAIEKAISEDRSELDLDTADGVYENPTILSTDKELKKQMEDLNDFLSQTVTYEMSDGSERVLDASTMKDWISQPDALHPYCYIDTSRLQMEVNNWIASVAADDDNYGNSRSFKSTNYGTVQVPTEAVHGHALDQTTMAQETYNALAAHTSLKKKVTYSVYEDDKDPQFGGSYVEVDVSSQEVYVYQNYECVYSTDVVTGNESTTPTPSGVWEIYYREKDASLTGEMKSDGTPSYISHVKYWMAFHEGYGLHDAWWRYGEFGGDIYEGNGSHGCVNLPESAAEEIWNLTDYGTPVIVFRA